MICHARLHIWPLKLRREINPGSLICEGIPAERDCPLSGSYLGMILKSQMRWFLCVFVSSLHYCAGKRSDRADEECAQGTELRVLSRCG